MPGSGGRLSPSLELAKKAVSSVGAAPQCEPRRPNAVSLGVPARTSVGFPKLGLSRPAWRWGWILAACLRRLPYSARSVPKLSLPTETHTEPSRDRSSGSGLIQGAGLWGGTRCAAWHPQPLGRQCARWAPRSSWASPPPRAAAWCHSRPSSAARAQLGGQAPARPWVSTRAGVRGRRLQAQRRGLCGAGDCYFRCLSGGDGRLGGRGLASGPVQHPVDL